MTIKLKDLIEKRGKVTHEARQILEKAQNEKRAMTAEEESKWTELMAEGTNIKQQIDQEQRMQEMEREDAEDAANHNPRPDQSGDEGIQQRALLILERDGREALSEDERKAIVVLEDKGLRTFLTSGLHAMTDMERRALQAGTDSAGGYLQPSEQFVNSLIQAVDDMVFIRPLATKYTVTSAEKLGAPSLENDPADSAWTSELAIGSEDSTMSFGKRELQPHPLAKLLKVSNKLLRAVPSAEGLVRDRLAYKMAITQEKAFLTGTGASQPLGVFTASSSGISTSQDVSTGNTTTSMTVDGLKTAKYTLKSAYHSRAQWIFHRDGVAQIAKLKDGEGRYYWQDSVVAGEPDRFLGFPVNMSEYAPNTFTTGLYVGILGDFSNYWIVDALTMTIQRLVELYAGTNQTGFITRTETDGAPVLEEAFVRVKLA